VEETSVNIDNAYIDMYWLFVKVQSPKNCCHTGLNVKGIQRERKLLLRSYL
jgi:hypothetical protein